METIVGTGAGLVNGGPVPDPVNGESATYLGYLRGVATKIPKPTPSVCRDRFVFPTVPTALRIAEVAMKPHWPGARMAAIGRAGDGNIRLSLTAPSGMKGRAAWMARESQMERPIDAIAVSPGRAFSAEHRIGQSKRHAMAARKDPVAWMRRVW